MNITGRTRMVGLFGYPVEHSLSPAMHNAAFEFLKLDYCYVPFSVRPDVLKNAVNSINALNLRGVNVTIPHKEKVLPFLHELSEEASFIGAVNTILNDNGKLKGFNTDGKGFMQSLQDAAIDSSGKKILIIGAGGAARAIGYYLCQTAELLFLYNRTVDKAESLRQHLNVIRGNVVSVDNALMGARDFFLNIDIVINTTPLGLRPDDPPPLDISLLNNTISVCDLIYRETPFLHQAARIGCKTLNGLGMLLWQGIYAFEIWTGILPPSEIMRRALLSAI